MDKQYVVVQDYVDGGSIGQTAVYGPFPDAKKAVDFARKHLDSQSTYGIVRLESPKDYE